MSDLATLPKDEELLIAGINVLSVLVSLVMQSDVDTLRFLAIIDVASAKLEQAILSADDLRRPILRQMLQTLREATELGGAEISRPAESDSIN